LLAREQRTQDRLESLYLDAYHWAEAAANAAEVWLGYARRPTGSSPEIKLSLEDSARLGADMELFGGDRVRVSFHDLTGPLGSASTPISILRSLSDGEPRKIGSPLAQRWNWATDELASAVDDITDQMREMRVAMQEDLNR
jgi:hypothetical protein